MNFFFILFVVLPILSFIGVFLLTDSLVYGIITLLVIDGIFTILFVKKQKRTGG